VLSRFGPLPEIGKVRHWLNGSRWRRNVRKGTETNGLWTLRNEPVKCAGLEGPDQDVRGRLRGVNRSAVWRKRQGQQQDFAERVDFDVGPTWLAASGRGSRWYKRAARSKRRRLRGDSRGRRDRDGAVAMADLGRQGERRGRKFGDLCQRGGESVCCYVGLCVHPGNNKIIFLIFSSPFLCGRGNFTGGAGGAP